MPRKHTATPTIPLDGFTGALQHSEMARHLVATAEEPWYRMESNSSDPVAHVYILDAIGGWFGIEASEFVRELTAIDKDQIHLHLNSPGGGVFDGVSIYNALKTHKANVKVIVEGLAASAASFIAQAGDEVVMLDGTMMMIHDASAIVAGNAKDMRDTAEVLDKISNNIAAIYAKRAGEPADVWRELMKEETWYNAQEAVDAGLADKVGDESTEDVKNKWDLVSVFNFAGRDEAPSPKEVRQLVFNRVQEARMTAKTAKNTHPDGEGEQSPGTTEAPVETPPVEAPSETPPVETPAETPDEAPVDPEVATEPENKGTFVVVNGKQVPAVMINGKATADLGEIQAYINTKEAAERESKTMNRKTFIKSLCDSKKILASQVADLETFVVGDGTSDNPGLTDKQYDKWCASWNAASSVGALNSGVGAGASGTPSDTARVEDEIDIALEIVKQHKRSNMPQDRLEKTESYQTLAAHNALDRLTS